jgi:hypothetical protein
MEFGESGERTLYIQGPISAKPCYFRHQYGARRGVISYNIVLSYRISIKNTIKYGCKIKRYDLVTFKLK